MKRETINAPFHHYWYHQQAARTHPCLIHCLINSLSSSVYKWERGVYAMQEHAFEANFRFNSREDDPSWGWTQAVQPQDEKQPVFQSWGLTIYVISPGMDNVLIASVKYKVLQSIKKIGQIYLQLNGALGNTGKQDAGAASCIYCTQSYFLCGWFAGLHNLFSIKF